MNAKKDDSMTPIDQAIAAPPVDASDPGPQDPNAQAMTVSGPSGAVTTREDFSGTESVEIVETASTALATQASKQVEARYLMALRFPRDMDVFRQSLLKDCARPSFAEVAEYEKPIGGKTVTGPSIRFVEAAIRNFRNVLTEVAAVYDDRRKRIVRVSVTDLETNVTYPMDVTIEKTVERSNPRQGENGPEYISARRNSYNKLTYLVEATEDDMLNKERALVSKAMRTVGLRILPGDIVEEAIRQARATLKDRAAKDPDAERRAIADAFASLNVNVLDLKTYLGHELDKSTPAELVELRRLWTALKSGEVTWVEIQTAKGAPENGGEKKGKAEGLLGKIGGAKSATV